MDLAQVTSVRMPRSRAELALAPGERFLGGGTWMYSVPPDPGVTGLVDLTAMGWKPYTLRDDDTLRIAATCTWEQLITMPEELAGDALPFFRWAARGLLASAKVWRVATVGGNLALAFPAGLMNLVAMSYGGSCLVWRADGSKRRVPAQDFVTAVMTTVLGPGEVLRAIELPRASLAHPVAYRTWAISPLGRTAGLASGRLRPDGRLRIVLAGATTRPYLFAFDGIPAASELAARIDAVDTWFGDPHGSLEWRRMMTYRAAEEIRVELSGREGRA
ncbi:MAG TPA: FAD binding domain-containing protein [Gryllotalpicola sp.]